MRPPESGRRPCTDILARCRRQLVVAPSSGSPASIAVMGFAAAFGIALLLISPLGDSPVGYDTAASVLYFKRLTHQQILEAPYGATPKPLMTVVDGTLYRLGGWAAISWLQPSSTRLWQLLGAC